MAHHAYVVAGSLDHSIDRARHYIKHELKLAPEGNPDVVMLRHGLFSVDDARAAREIAERAPLTGDTKVLVIAAGRIFHEAQNALLKLFEEPPKGVFLILVVPSKGMLLPTLRSRLLPLPTKVQANDLKQTDMIYHISSVEDFLKGKKDVRQTIVAKLLERAKSDKDEEKQAARLEALELLEGLMRAAYVAYLTQTDMIYHISGKGGEKGGGVSRGREHQQIKELRTFLEEVNAFIPILHERSAPLKPIFEHILLTIPSGLEGSR